MTVIADNKKRVTLPTKPGERFDVQVVSEDKFILTRLVPVKPPRPRLVKRNGLTVISVGRRVMQAEIDRALEEFP